MNFKNVMVNEVKRCDIEVRMNTEVNADVIKEIAPDHIHW